MVALQSKNLFIDFNLIVYLMKQPTLKLVSNHSIPILGLGTWELRGKQCEEAVKKALDLGYRHIDTAEMYGNQKEIGRAIKNFPRSELFITSNVWMTNLRHNSVLRACENTLKELDTSYLDLYLIHCPDPDVPVEETLKAMGVLSKEGKVKSIGVSNFNISRLKQALKVEVPISVNQVEFHPYLYQKELLEFCKKNDIVIIAYSPLARRRIFDDKTLKGLAEKYEKSVAQISLRWLFQKGIVVIPKASSEQHLIENMDIFDWKLSNEDVKKIDSIEIKYRIVNVAGTFD